MHIYCFLNELLKQHCFCYLDETQFGGQILDMVSLSTGGDSLVEGADAAVAGALLHLHEAVLAPASAPGVLDEPVVLSTLAAIADNQDSVVQVVDAAAV